MTFRIKGALFGSQPPNDPIDAMFGDDLDWVTDEAACLDHPERDALFFPGSGSVDRRAFDVCHTCPLLEPCRDYAVARKGVMGVWGATSEAQREAIRAGREPSSRAYAPCGTRAACEAHRRRNEKPCEKCLAAERAWRRARRAKEQAA